ncbi:hypothetical protein ACVJGC_005078 [Bradyrhizobium diazoefficiens]
MRLPILTLTAIVMLFAAADARAQTYDPRYPVCMHVYTPGGWGGGGDYYDCSFTSLPQCRATASGCAPRAATSIPITLLTSLRRRRAGVTRRCNNSDPRCGTLEHCSCVSRSAWS